MARTKGITLRVRKDAAEDASALPITSTDTSATTTNAAVDEDPQPKAELQDEEMAPAEGSRGAGLSRSRSSRLSRTRSYEEAFGAASSFHQSDSLSPSTSPIDETGAADDIEMGSPQPPEADQGKTRPKQTTPKQRTTQHPPHAAVPPAPRVKGSTTPVFPQTPSSSSRSQRSPEKVKDSCCRQKRARSLERQSSRRRRWRAVRASGEQANEEGDQDEMMAKRERTMSRKAQTRRKTPTRR